MDNLRTTTSSACSVVGTMGNTVVSKTDRSSWSSEAYFLVMKGIYRSSQAPCSSKREWHRVPGVVGALWVMRISEWGA